MEILLDDHKIKIKRDIIMWNANYFITSGNTYCTIYKKYENHKVIFKMLLLGV